LIPDYAKDYYLKFEEYLLSGMYIIVGYIILTTDMVLESDLRPSTNKGTFRWQFEH